MLRYPVEVPGGAWAVTLRTTWVEPAYLETDASWCSPGGCPASPLANGGALGGKRCSPVPESARDLAQMHGMPVRASDAVFAATGAAAWIAEGLPRDWPRRRSAMTKVTA